MLAQKYYHLLDFLHHLTEKKTVTPSHLECMVNILMFTSKKIYIKTDKGMASVFLQHAIKK